MSKKISELNTSAKPLSGSETVVMNQNGSTVTSSINDVKVFTDTLMKALSTNWQNTFTTFKATSANYALKNTNNNFSTNQTIQGTLSAHTYALSGTTLSLGKIGNSNSIGITNTNAHGVSDSLIVIGFNAGFNVINGSYSIFLGEGAGKHAENATDSIFLGYTAGLSAFNSSGATFIGSGSGNGAKNATNSIFIGNGAGYEALNSQNSIFLGYAGDSALSAYQSNFLGYFSGSESTGNNVNAFGQRAGESNTGNHNQFLGAFTTTDPKSLSGCLVLGMSAAATQNNTIALGSTAVPFLTASSGNDTGSFLVIRLNGVNLKIPLYS
jgi:hypothetical protein